MRTAIFEISLLIAAFILGWLKTGLAAVFYIALGLIVFYAIVMVIYMILKRSKLSSLDRILGVVALAGWLVIAWAMIQEKGLLH